MAAPADTPSATTVSSGTFPARSAGTGLSRAVSDAAHRPADAQARASPPKASPPSVFLIINTSFVVIFGAKPIINADDVQRHGRQLRSPPYHSQQRIVASSAAWQSRQRAGRRAQARDDGRYAPAGMCAKPARRQFHRQTVLRRFLFGRTPPCRRPLISRSTSFLPAQGESASIVTLLGIDGNPLGNLRSRAAAIRSLHCRNAWPRNSFIVRRDVRWRSMLKRL